MASLHESASALLPRLTAGNYRVTSPASTDYNCIAWAAGRTDAWWWPKPGWFWPVGAPIEETLSAFVAAFATLGYASCDSSDLEPGVGKIAVYAVGDVPTHAARQLPQGGWSSKLGPNVDIEHDTRDAVAGGVYGEPVLFLGRPLSAPTSTDTPG